jgi:hypothetical protein
VAAPGGGTTGGGLTVAMIANELAIMLSTAFDGDNPTSWSFLEPLRPALSLPLPLSMVVATRAATAKHAAIILRGVETVMVEISGGAETIEWKIIMTSYLHTERTAQSVKSRDVRHFHFLFNGALTLNTSKSSTVQ